MYKKLFFPIIWLFTLLIAFNSYAVWINDVDVTVSPVRYELSGDPWTSVIKNIKVINNSLKEVQLNINKKDCTSANSSWNPRCFSPESNQNIGGTLAPWISTSSDTIGIPAQGEKDIQFTINIPSDANPWWHYGSIFFSYGTNSGTHMIETIKEVWVILLLNVSWDVVITWEVKDISIQTGGDSWWWANTKKNPSLKERLISFIKTEFKTEKNTNNLAQWKKKDTNIDFWITFENTGNTHIKPKWKITIQDENGNVIKRVGEETVKNDDGIIVGKKIVDYIPINDEWGNVLPWSNRKFSQNWKGFPYKKIDENGETVIDYKNIGDYYTEKNLKDKNILMMWEKIKTREKNEKMKANIDISYKWKDNEDIDFNSAKDFNVNYTEQYIGINWLIVWPAWIIFFIFFIIFIIKRRKKVEEKVQGKEKNTNPKKSLKKSKK